MSTRRHSVYGFILIETAVALVVLSAGAFVVHGTIQQALQTRGQAQDFTRARFLFEGLVSRLELQPELTVHSREGQFDGEHSRFSWSYRVGRVDVPKPAAPLRPRPKNVKVVKRFAYQVDHEYLAHVRVTVNWSRSGKTFSESYETLLPSRKLWQPPKPVLPR